MRSAVMRKHNLTDYVVIIQLLYHSLCIAMFVNSVSNKEALLATYFHAGFLLGLFLDPEDGGDMYLRNVG
jgi:p-aminobenzoyl-glutamate transporter AbgT